MAVEITMPQLSDTMSEGRILTWRKKEGEAVKRGEALAEVATDKADLEIESFHQGQLLKIFAPEGSTVKVGSIIAVIGEAGEKIGTDAPKVETKSAAAPQPAVSAPAPQAAASQPAARPEHVHLEGTNGTDRIKISPLAKNVARAHGVDYSVLTGSGEGGRIVKRDVESALSAAPASAPAESRPPTRAPLEPGYTRQAPAPAPQPARGGTEDLSRMRQTIATRMVESKTTIPHFYMTTTVVADELARMRNTLKGLPQYEGITFNHLVVRAAGLALRAFPRINSAYSDGKLVQPLEVNIGVVTALPDGLLIPVLKGCDHMHLADIVSEGRAMIQRAKGGRPKSDDLVGATFSISNVGALPVESFSAIISPGQGAILAVGGINEEPVVVDGQLRVGQVMRLTLSVDHRIIDGVMAGEFLRELKRLLESPVLLVA